MPATTVHANSIRSGRRVAHLISKSGRAYSLGMTPESATIANAAYSVEEIPRPGKRPLTRLTAPQNLAYRFEHQMIWTRSDLVRSANALILLAQRGEEVRIINVSNIEAGTWFRIQSLTVTIAERREDQRPKVLQCAWELIESIDVQPKIGKTPPPGGMFKADLQPIDSLAATSNSPGGSTYDSQVPPAASTPTTTDQGKPTHTVTAGETLYSVAATTWGNGYFWPYIYNHNKAKLKWDDRLAKPEPGRPTTAGQTKPSTGNRYLKVGLVLDIPTLPGQHTNTAGPNGTGYSPGS
jgi:hypothetical protein